MDWRVVVVFGLALWFAILLVKEVRRKIHPLFRFVKEASFYSHSCRRFRGDPRLLYFPASPPVSPPTTTRPSPARDSSCCLARLAISRLARLLFPVTPLAASASILPPPPPIPSHHQSPLSRLCLPPPTLHLTRLPPPPHTTAHTSMHVRLRPLALVKRAPHEAPLATLFARRDYFHGVVVGRVHHCCQLLC